MKKKLLFTWLALGVILLVTYYLLGGFTEIKVSLTNEPAFEMIGKMYNGPVSSKKLDKLVQEIREKYDQGELEGVFGLCFFSNPDETDTVDVLVGIISEKLVKTPVGWIKKKFGASQAITASIAAEAVVAPSASETNKKINEFAQQESLEISGIYIEKYVEDFKIITVVPVSSSKKIERNTSE